MLSLYTNGAPGTIPEKIGLFPYPPYYWWQSGATWAGLVDYTTYTGDYSLVPTITTALLAQKGPDENYIVTEHRFDTGNDDQAFWGLGLMSAIEGRFPEPDPSELKYGGGWFKMLVALFDNQTARWDTTSCGGGLKWQIYPENDYGYNYKNAVSNGAYFQLAARLARYTGNPTYVAQAMKTWDWCVSIGLVNEANYDVYDGSDDKLNCTELDHTRWSYNVALFLYGAAAMWDVTHDAIWVERVNGLVDAASVFFTPYDNASDIMFEAACERVGTCNTDQYSFKAYLSRWLAKTMVLAPWTRQRIWPWLKTSAVAAARSCSGDADGSTCGFKWYVDGDGWDGTSGLGQQQSALEAVISLLVFERPPFSAYTGTTASMPDESEETEAETWWFGKRHGDEEHHEVPPAIVSGSGEIVNSSSKISDATCLSGLPAWSRIGILLAVAGKLAIF